MAGVGSRSSPAPDARVSLVGMKRPVAVVVGVLLVVVGALWTLQGLGYVGGSAMSGVTLWAVVGPIVVVAGVLVALWGARRKAAR
jgi:hypothetical protein